MTQKQIDKQLTYLHLEKEDQKADIYNSLTRIQNLMSLDVMFINKAEEIFRKEHNVDLQSSTEIMQRVADQNAMIQSMPKEPKGSLVTIPVVIKGNEVLSYVIRLGESMPAFNFWPRGREIIQRLVMRAAMADSLDEFKLYRTSEESIRSMIFATELSPRSTARD